MENNTTHSCNNNSSKYTGVRKRKWGKYVSEIRLPNSRERIWLGSYDSAVKAARAFDAALYCLRGPTARFNFPDNPPDIPGGRSLTPAQIQVEAARFAHSGRVESDHEDSSSFGSGLETKQVGSPSVSDGTSTCTTHVGNVDGNIDNSYLDHFRVMGSDPEFGYYPGFDDFQNELLLSGPSVDYYEVEESCNEYNGSYLWNF